MPYWFEDTEEEIEERPRPLPGAVRAPVKGASRFFGGAVGAIPELAETARQAQPFIEEREQEARPSFLGEAGLEPAPERGLLNLLSLLGKSETVQKLRPQALEERFKETTQGRFEPQSAVERILARAAGTSGEGLPFGIPPGLGFLGGLGRGVAEEAGLGETGQTISELLGMGLHGIARRVAQAATKAPARALSKEAQEFAKIGEREGIPVFRGTTEEPFKAAQKASVAKPSRKSFERGAQMEKGVRTAKEKVTEKAIPILGDIKEGKNPQKLYREAYEEARSLAKNVKTRPNTEAIEKTIDRTIKDLNKIPGETPQVKETINFLKDSYQDLVAKGKNTLEGLMGFNARLNELIYKTGSKERKLLDRVKKANDHVIKTFTQKENPRIYQKWKEGNRLFAENAKANQLGELLDPIFTERGIEYEKFSSLFEKPKSRQSLENLLGKKATNRLEQISRLASRQGALLRKIGILNEREVARRWGLPRTKQELDAIKLGLAFGNKSLRSVAKLIGIDKARQLYGDMLTNPELQNKWANFLRALPNQESKAGQRAAQAFIKELKTYLPDEKK